MARLVALIGPPGCGKTTVCTRLATLARARGLRVAGLLSPGAPGDPSGRGSRLVVDLATGAARPLGRRTGSAEGARHWDLDEAALAWGEQAVQAGAAGADVLIIDELGRLELGEGRGWVGSVTLFRQGGWRLAVASVREDHLDAFRVLLGACEAALEVVRVNDDNRDRLPERLAGDIR